MNDKLYSIMNWPMIEGVEYTDISNPGDLLGQHVTDDGLLIQAFLPDAEKVEIKYLSKQIEMNKMDDKGFFAALLDEKKKIKYNLLVKYGEDTVEFYDPYEFESDIPEKALRKFNAGINYEVYEILGSHYIKRDDLYGTRFAVWAPFALRVSVVGEFNNWDGRRHQMNRIGETGVFELFIPELKPGQVYKYEIKKKGNDNIIKSDPYAFEMEGFPKNASVVCDIDNFNWNDSKWIMNREKQDVNSMPISVYEMNVGTFSKDLDGKVNYTNIAKKVAEYVKQMGYTHVQLMPIMEYAIDDSIGYETSNFYAPTKRYGEPEDFMNFVNEMHQNNIGVIIEFVPNEFYSDESGMAGFDGSSLYEHMDPKKGINPRTGGYMFNYARPEVSNYLIAAAFMWINKYHIDGLKFSNIASMLYLDYDRQPGEWIENIYGGNENLDAVEFIKHLNSIMHKTKKGIVTIAEDNSGYPGVTGEVSEECVGFDFKWNGEWTKEILEYLAIPPYKRESHYNDLSMSMLYQYKENYFVGFQSKEFIGGKPSLIAAMTGDTEEQKFANMRLALSYMFVHPGKKTLFMGQDMAQYNEWLKGGNVDFELLNIAKHKNINNMVKALNKLYVSEPALYELDDDSEGFEWINNISARESILTFVRKGNNYSKKNVKDIDMLIVVCNFDAVDRSDYKIGVPRKGKYKEIFNSDSSEFGGKKFVNPRLKQSKTDECDGREDSIRINVPALGITILKFSKNDEKLAGNKEAKANLANKKLTETKKAETVKKSEPAKKVEPVKRSEPAKKAETVKKTESAKKAETVKK